MAKRAKDFELVETVMTELGGMDGAAANIVINGKTFKGELKAYRKGRTRDEKDWFDAIKPILKETIAAAKLAQKAFEKLVKRYRDLTKDGKFTSFSRSFRDALEVFEDLVAQCIRYIRKFDKFMGDHGIGTKNRWVVANRGWPHILSFGVYTSEYRDRYKDLKKKAKKVASLRSS